MNPEIIKFLHEIEERPGVFLGKKTLKGLCEYVEGYAHCMYTRDGVHPEWLQGGFQKFVEKHYDLHDNIHTNRYWPDIIQFFNPSEERAFDEFYELMDEFLKERTSNQR